MKIVVTGATGFLGRAVVADLVAESHEVRAIVRDAATHEYKMSAFVQGIVKSQAFRMMKPTETPATTDVAAPARQ